MSRETYLLRMGGHRWADILQWMMGAEVSSYPRIILIALVSTEPTYSYHICLNRLPDIQPGPDQRVSLSAHAQYLDLHIFCLLIPWIQVCLSSVWSYPEGFCLFLPWIASANYVYFFFYPDIRPVRAAIVSFCSVHLSGTWNQFVGAWSDCQPADCHCLLLTLTICLKI